MKRKLFSPYRLLIASAAGILLGFIAHAFFPPVLNNILLKWILTPLGDIFLRSMKMMVAPLVLCSLICGVADMGDLKKLGRVGGKILSFYLLTTALAVVLALLAANLIHPGMNISPALPAEYNVAEVPFIMDVFVNIIPSSFMEALSKGDVLQIVAFAVLCGIGITMIGASARPFLNVVIQGKEIMLRILSIIMKLAPYGVFALISKSFMVQGLDVLLPLLKYVLTVLLILSVQTLLVYGAVLKLWGKVNPLNFFKKYGTVMAVAFSTASSNAAIPVNMNTCQKKLGVSEEIASLTIPLGAAVNKNGTAIMQGVAVVFIAQAFGIELSILQQLLTILIVTAAAIGTAGVPGAAILLLSMILQQLGLPAEGIALVLSVDVLLDMARTVVNVTGDAVGTVVVANSEKALNLELYHS